MKKMFFMMVLAIVGVATVSAQLRFGVKAGLNTSTVSGLKESLGEDFFEEGVSVPYKAGFHVGVSAQYLFTDALGIEAGLYYSQIGGKIKSHMEEGGVTADMAITFNPSYLQLPIQLLYKIDLGSGLAIVPSAGLYLGYALGGKTGVDVKSSNAILEGILKEGIKESKIDQIELFKPVKEEGFGFNRFDYGLALGLNLEYQKFVIGLGYDLGLAKLNGKDSIMGDEDLKKDFKNANIRVSVGYFF